MLTALHPILAAADLPSAITFYQTLGFTLLFQDHPATSRYAAVERDHIELLLQWADAGQWAYPVDRPVYRFLVQDVDALYREYLANGVIAAQTGASPWHKPAHTPWGTYEFHLRDPGQNGLQFYQTK